MTGEMVAKATGHAEIVTGVIFLPDCKHIVSVRFFHFNVKHTRVYVLWMCLYLCMYACVRYAWSSLINNYTPTV